MRAQREAAAEEAESRRRGAAQAKLAELEQRIARRYSVLECLSIMSLAFMANLVTAAQAGVCVRSQYESFIAIPRFVL